MYIKSELTKIISGVINYCFFCFFPRRLKDFTFLICLNRRILRVARNAGHVLINCYHTCGPMSFELRAHYIRIENNYKKTLLTKNI